MTSEPDSGTPPVRLVPADAFASVRARWLPLVAVITLIAMLVAASIVQGLLGVSANMDELFGALLYVPLIGWALWEAWRHKVDLRVFFRVPHIGRYWGVVLGMTLALFAFSIGAGNITGALFPDYTASANVTTEAGFPLLFVSLVVLPPFVEELIFRGVLLERWSVKWRLGVAIVVQAIAFGVLHVDPVGAGMFGVVMALMYIRTRSLWVPITMHAINNGTVLLFVFLVGDTAADQAPQSVGEAAIGGAIFIALSLPFLVLFVIRNWPDARTVTPYELARWGPGALPPRHLGPALVVTGPFGIQGRRGRLWLQPDRLVLNADRRGRRTLTTIPYPAIRDVSVSSDLRTVCLTAGDGTAATLTLPQRSKRVRAGIVGAVEDRLLAVDGPAAVRLEPAPR